MPNKKPLKDPVADLLSKLSKAKHTLHLLQSDNDHNTLHEHYKQYKKTKNLIYKESYAKFNKWSNLTRKIKKLKHNLQTKYNHIIPDEEICEEEIGEDGSNHQIHICNNCHRHDIINNINDYSLDLSPIQSSDIKTHRQYGKLSRTCSRDQIQYTVCIQCKNLLTLINTDEATEYKNIWPSFLWEVFSSNETIKAYGASFIWKFIPFEWREWWYHELKRLFPFYYRNITLDNPKPIFLDKTKDLMSWNDAIESQKLSQIADVCNQHLIPTVLCPWGCSDFLHHAGSIKLNLIIQRYLQKCVLFDDDTTTVDPTRDDYVRDNANDYDKWLGNLSWKVMPTIIMKAGVPFVLSCKDHDCGDCHFHLHCPRWSTNLSAHFSDQLCHAVVKPRTIKTMKIGYNSTSYQMVEQRTSWKGPDSINITSCGHTDHNSILLKEAEGRSYRNRTDMKSLIKRLIDDNKMSSDHAQGIEQFAEIVGRRHNFSMLKEGSTYVPAVVAISMKEEARNREVTATIDDDFDEEENPICPYPKKFKRIWPLYIYPCQKVTKYGTKMLSTLLYSVPYSMLLWLTSSLLIKVETIWNIFATSDLKTSEWVGYLLTDLTKTTLHYINRRITGIFGKKNVNELVTLLNSYGDNLASIFHIVPDIICIDMDEEEDELLTTIRDAYSNERVIIVTNVSHQNNLPELITIDDDDFELRYVASIYNQHGEGLYQAEAYSRHGKHFSKWWYKHRNKKNTTCVDHMPSIDKTGHQYTIVYVKVFDFDEESTKKKFLKLLGGQCHVLCETHSLPLVVSRGTNECSSCNKRREYLCCSISFCKVNICKKCFKTIDESEIYFQQESSDNEISSDSESSTYSDGSSTDSHNSNNSDDYNGDQLFELSIPQPDSSDDLLGMCDPPDIDDDDFSSKGSVNSFEIGLTEMDEEEIIPTTNAADENVDIQAETVYGGRNNEFTISGSGLLCETTSLLTRKRHEIHGSRSEKYFVQRFCASTKGTCFPLLYPESAMFPSIFWTMAEDNISVSGAIPSPLLCGLCQEDGFAPIPQHIRTRVTNPSSSTSSDYRYLIFGHDLLCTLAANHNDMRQNRRGMTAANDSVGGLDLRGKDDSNFLHSIDSRQMVKNLCTSQEYFEWDIFLTFTCNMRKHFGTKPIREWLDSDDWTESYPYWDSYSNFEQEEIKRALHQSASGLFLRVWEEVSAIFIEYLSNSSSSPFQKLMATFARKEYQADKGNLSHIHLLGKVNNLQDKNELFELVRNNVIDIIKPDEIDSLLDEGILQHKDDTIQVQTDGLTYLIHTCNSRCLVPDKNGNYVCRATNFQKSKENTKHILDSLPNNFSKECLNRLEKAGIVQIERNESGEIESWIGNHDYLHPKKHMPPWKYGDPNISPCETITFLICRSMQNVQCLCGAGGGSCKYCCKYVGKVDKNNYCSVASTQDGNLIRRDNMLHNTKRVTSDRVQQMEREKKRSWKHPQGQVVSTNEILHHVLKYPEVYTDLRFVQIPTTSLETRAGNSIRSRTEVTDNTNVVNSINIDREDLPINRQFTDQQNELYKDMQLYRKSVRIDKITQFSLRPPELRLCIDMVGKYYRWFNVSSVPLSTPSDLIDDDIYNSAWVDGMGCQIFLRVNALSELLAWLSQIENEGNADQDMITFLRRLDVAISTDEDQEFCSFAFKQLLFEDDRDEHLPIPVYSFIKPTMAPEFLLHILLSMGRFQTEREVLLHPTLRDSFNAAKLVGNETDDEHLTMYSNDLMNNFFNKQLVYYPNGQRIIDSWIIHAGDLFDSIIINNEMPMNEMPAVQLSALLSEQDDVFERFQKELINNVIHAAIRQIGDAYERCNVPLFEELSTATLDDPLDWDPVSNFRQSPGQSIESYEEQTIAIKTCVDSIDKYRSVMNTEYVKNIVITGFPGGGKTFVMMYVLIYARSKGLVVVSVAMMSHRAIQLGGIHWHKLLCIPVDRSNNMSVYRMTELAIRKMEMYHPMHIQFLKSIHMFATDEIGQSSAQFDSVIDNIIRLLCGVNIYKGNKLEIGTYDPTQLQPIRGQPFLVSPNIIPCYKIVPIKNSVRAQNQDFFRLQQIARTRYKELLDNPQLIDEFEELCEGFTFVPSWDSPLITPDTFRIYARNIPAKEASRNFVASVKRNFSRQQLRLRSSIDLQRRRFSHQEWGDAIASTRSYLDQQVKEQDVLCFFKGAVFQFTFNHTNSVFSQSQLALCYDLPSQDNLDSFRSIQILAFPNTIKYDSFQFDETKNEDYYISTLGFKKVTMTVAPENICFKDDVKCMRKQYGLRHYVTGTIHSAMGDTYNKMAMSISDIQKQYSIWDRGQLIVAISRTRLMENTIFVGNKTETINAMKKILTQRTQWCDYIDQVINIITVKSVSVNPPSRAMNQVHFPFRICDISLPQDQTGAVFLFLSKKDKSVHIGKTLCIRSMLRKQNSGISTSALPLHLRPYVLLAYIVGFDRNIGYMEEIKDQWADRQNTDIKCWAKSAQDIIHFDDDLKVIYLFRD